MYKKEFETLKNLIDSNNSFCDALKEKNPIEINIYLQIELILLYFKINYQYINQLNLKNQSMIIDILCNNNFYIEDNTIIYKDEKYSIDYFNQLVNQMEQIRFYNQQRKIIEFNPKPKGSNISQIRKAKIIDITFINHKTFLDMTDRAHMFEEGLEVTADTLPYIKENKSNFKDLLNVLVLSLLNQTLNEPNYNYLELLASYLCLYPVISYSKDKFTIPFHHLKIPKERIGLKKSSYHDEYLDELSLEIKQLRKKRNRLILNREALPKSLQNYKAKVERINAHIDAVEREQIDCYYNQYAYRNLDEIYNPYLLEFLFKSFEQCNVSIDKMFQDPVIRFFYISNSCVHFYCAMHLNTLFELSDYKAVIPSLENIPSLKYTI